MRKMLNIRDSIPRSKSDPTVSVTAASFIDHASLIICCGNGVSYFTTERRFKALIVVNPIARAIVWRKLAK